MDDKELEKVIAPALSALKCIDYNEGVVIGSVIGQLTTEIKRMRSLLDGTTFVDRELLIKWLDMQRPLLKDDGTEEYEYEHKYEYGKLRMIEKTKRLLQYGDDWKDLDTDEPSKKIIFRGSVNELFND